MDRTTPIDMESREWQALSPGTLFRSRKAHECETCGTMSNEWLLVQSCNFRGPIFQCPAQNRNPELHDKLEMKMENLHEGHPKPYQEALKQEIEELKGLLKVERCR